MRTVGLVLAWSVLVLSLLRGGWPLHPEVAARPYVTLACIAAGLTMAFGPAGDILRRGVHRVVFASPRPLFNLSLFAAGALAGAVVALKVFDAVPYLDDGVASLFQARIFSRGELTLPIPPMAEFFVIFGIIGAEEGLGHWAGMYPPGWPALLLPGVLVGIPWMVNPLLGGALAVATSELGRELYDDRTGRVAGILCLFSPFLLILAGTHLSHISTALALGVCLWAVLRLHRTGRWWYGPIAGLSWGIAFLSRPLDALLLGILFALIPAFRWREALNRKAGIALALAAALMAAGLLAAFQGKITGNPMTPGHKVGLDKYGSFGFIPLKNNKAHTPAKAVEHSLWRLRALGDRLTGWPLPFFLFPLAAMGFSGSRRRDTLVLLSLLVLLSVYAFYWYYEGFFPARYLSAAAPMLLAMGGRGAVIIFDRAAGNVSAPKRLATAAFTACVLFSLLAAVPGEVRRVRINSGDVERALPGVVEAYRISNAVVFMDHLSPGTVEQAKLNDFYATGFMRNDLDLQGDVIFARNSRERNLELTRAYPGRNYFLYRFHRDTKRAFLYRLLPRGEDFCLVSVPPGEPGLLLFDATRSGDRDCVGEVERSRSRGEE